MDRAKLAAYHKPGSLPHLNTAVRFEYVARVCFDAKPRYPLSVKMYQAKMQRQKFNQAEILHWDAALHVNKVIAMCANVPSCLPRIMAD